MELTFRKSLVVDDSKVAFIKLKKMLLERGIESEWVESGEASIDYLRKNRPDIVFMDIMMPGMGGFAATEQIYADSTIKDPPPVVMCSGNADEGNRDIARKVGALGFLAKGGTVEDLDNLLVQVRENLLKPRPSLNSSSTDEPTVEQMRQIAREVAHEALATALPTVLNEKIDELARQSAEHAVASALLQVEETAQRSVDQSIREVMGTIEQKAKESADQALSKSVSEVQSRLNTKMEGVLDQLKSQMQTKIEQTLKTGREDLLNQALPQLMQDAQNQFTQIIMQSRGDINNMVVQIVEREIPNFEQHMNQAVELAVQRLVTKARGDLEQAAAKQAASTIETSLAEAGSKGGGGGLGTVLGAVGIVLGLVAIALVFVMQS